MILPSRQTVPSAAVFSRERKTIPLNRIAFYDIVEQVGLGSDPDGDPGYPIVSFYLNGKEISKVLEIAALLPEVFGNEFFSAVVGLALYL